MTTGHMSEALEYAPGRLLDTYGEPSAATVLLWHGSGPDERDVLATLATALAARGLQVVVPDWDSTVPDGGRTDLFLSAKYMRELGHPFLVAGWSLGGTAAASMALNSRKLGLGIVPAVCLAGAFTTTDPLSGVPFSDLKPSERNQGSIRLVHGLADDIVPIEGARDFAGNLRRAGWDTALIELPVDHAGIVGTAFVADRSRCVLTQDPQVVLALKQVVEVIVESALRTRPAARP